MTSRYRTLTSNAAHIYAHVIDTYQHARPRSCGYTCLLSLYMSGHLPAHMPARMPAHVSLHMSIRMSARTSTHCRPFSRPRWHQPSMPLRSDALADVRTHAPMPARMCACTHALKPTCVRIRPYLCCALVFYLCTGARMVLHFFPLRELLHPIHTYRIAWQLSLTPCRSRLLLTPVDHTCC